ncbi:non-ribosomal peptide synthase protein (TIGR01720 family), partial [Algoriphagus sp. 4150]|uniref:condensation domain-containing protein n=1 Tax=Algoriphagus sp. 4150 TaxID=2817756 RepID=UPI00286726EE
KLDKRSLPEADFSSQQSYVGARTETESVLCGIWQNLLGINKIGVNDNFFALGGNSIISIQVISHARRSGINLKPKDLYQYQTILLLSAQIDKEQSENIVSPIEDSDFFELLPIQQWFFSRIGDALSNMSQSLIISLDKKIEQASIVVALNQVIKSHDALNVSYYKQNNKWFQKYVDHSIELLQEDFTHLPNPNLSEQCEILSNTYRAQLSPVSGELIKAIVIKTHSSLQNNYLFLIVHHLAIDDLSWLILKEDLESTLNQLRERKKIELRSNKGAYKKWYRGVLALASMETILSQKNHWKDIVKYTQSLSQNVYEIDPSSAIGGFYKAEFPMQLTNELLSQVHRAYQTETVEILLAALNQVIIRNFGFERVVIGMLHGGHVNSSLFPDINQADLVGWLSTLYPVLLAKQTGDSGNMITAIKEQLRFSPGYGIGYGVLRYLHPQDQVRNELEINNFELIFQHREQLGSIISKEKKSHNKLWPPVVNSEEFQFLNGILLTSSLSEGQLTIHCNYSKKRYHELFIRELTDGIIQSLNSLIHYCLKQKHTHYSKSDYREITFDQKYWVDREIEENYKLKDKRHGAVTMNFLLRGNFNQDVYQESLKYLLIRHESLRSSFIVYNGEPTLRVLSLSDLPKYSDFKDFSFSNEGKDDFIFFENHCFDLKKGPLFLSRVAQLRKDEFVLSFRVHHVIMDDWSIGVLLRDFFVAYKSISSKKVPPLLPLKRQFKDYIMDAVISIRENYTNHKNYWLTAYNGLPPELVLPFAKPRVKYDIAKKIGRNKHYYLESSAFENIKRKAIDRSTSVFNILHSILIGYLNSETGQKDICIGTQIFRRDHWDIENQIGFYAKTVLMRTKIENVNSFDNIVDSVIVSDSEMLTYTACPYSEAAYSLLQAGDIIFGKFWKVDLHYKSGQGFYVNPADFEDNDLEIVSYINQEKSESIENLVPYDLQLTFVKEENAFRLMVNYDSNVFSEQSLDLFFSGYFAYSDLVFSDIPTA